MKSKFTVIALVLILVLSSFGCAKTTIMADSSTPAATPPTASATATVTPGVVPPTSTTASATPVGTTVTSTIAVNITPVPATSQPVSTTPAPTPVWPTVEIGYSLAGGLDPATITIIQGTTVKWVNSSHWPHFSIASDGPLNFGMDNISVDGYYEFTFYVAGTYPYRETSSGSLGLIIVQ